VDESRRANTSHPVLEMEEKEKSSLIPVELTTPRDPTKILMVPNHASRVPVPSTDTSHKGASF